MRRILSSLQRVLVPLIWAFAQQASATRPIPPPITLEEKVKISEVIAVAQLVGAVCIDPSTQNVRNTMICDKAGYERRFAQLKIESLLCARDLRPIASQVYLPIWSEALTSDESRAVNGDRFIVFLRRQYSDGPYATDRFFPPVYRHPAWPEKFDQLENVRKAVGQYCQ